MPKWERLLISASLRSTRDKFISRNDFITERKKYISALGMVTFGGWEFEVCSDQWFQLGQIAHWFFLDGAGTFYQDYTKKKSSNLFAL